MNLRVLPRVFAWAAAVGFFADLLRRCWIVEAWSIFPLASVAFALCLQRLRVAWRCARRRGSADFIRIR